MSNSSRAAFGGFYVGAMRNAAPILFWLSLVLFAVTLASYASVFFPGENDSTDAMTRAYMVFGGTAHAVNNAVLPFAGAAIVWAVNQSATGGAK